MTTDVLALRASLAALLFAELGTYVLANGETADAISVRAPGEPMAPNTGVIGLELIIERDPELVPIVQYSDAPALSNWNIWLVDWGGDSANPVDAARAIVQAFPGSEFQKVTVPPGIGPANQVRVTLRGVTSNLAPTVILDGGNASGPLGGLALDGGGA